MEFLENLVTGKELIGIKKQRSQTYELKRFDYELQSKYEAEGWTVDKKLKSKVRMKRPKSLDEQFENEVWCLFADLGFSWMNRDRHFVLPYTFDGQNTTKQIDVFASDEETVLFVECKCANSSKTGNFKTDLEAISGIRGGIFAAVRQFVDFSGKKCKYVFATKNYKISEADKKRMTELQIYHLDESAIRYFSELSKHLGTCARFQFLGSLFAGQKINNIENKVPAIKGEMGSYTYYSFSIEPEKLLKLAYVLHRNDAHIDMMPTYQRIIKQSRLKEIQEFVDRGGFFPNSLIISINTQGKKLQFDLANTQVRTANSRIGILHLPQYYRSVYIIDGQHRLYGYANSQYVANNSIPVVAFENLDQRKQLELFMQINENQKGVSKNLRNTLNADLLWSSENPNDQRRGLRLAIAQKLGDDPQSPLFGRVITGENEENSFSCLKIDTFESALKSTNFLKRFTKKNKRYVEIEDGRFDLGDNQSTCEILLNFLMDCFQYFKDMLPDEWERGKDQSGILTINNTIYALIRITNDIINHVADSKKINPRVCKRQELMETVKPYLFPLVSFFKVITDEQRREICVNYGNGGRTNTWRRFEQVIQDSCPDFSPDGLDEWNKDNIGQLGKDSSYIIEDILSYMKADLAEKLKSRYGEEWERRGIPYKVYQKASKSQADKLYHAPSQNITLWDCVDVSYYRNIVKDHWKELFEAVYTRPEEKRIKGGKQAKTEWLSKFSDLAKKSKQNRGFSRDDFKFLKELHTWLCK